MVYLGRAATPPLDRFIERIWYCSVSTASGRERVLPGGGAVDLVINLVDEDITIYDDAGQAAPLAHSGALVGGSYTHAFLADPRQRASVIGVHFRPGGALPFLGVSPAELVDSHVALQDVWGALGRELREQLVELRTPGDRFLLIERALRQRLERARPGHPAISAAIAALRGGGPQPRVSELAKRAGLSRRRFIEVFEREAGLTPKLFARLQRFHHVKQRLAALGEAPAWANFALGCGYFDQSHLIRDFVEFAGITPSGYLQAKASETKFDHLVHTYDS